MKKILLLLAAVSAYCTADAVNLTFWMGNKKIEANEKVVFNNITVDNYEADGFKEVTMDPGLSVSSDIYSSDIKITADCTSGQDIQVCINGLCRSGKTVVCDKVTLRPNQKLELGFHYINEFDLAAEIPPVTTVIEAEDVTEPASKVQFVIEMGPEGNSVTAVEVFDDFKAVEGGVAFKAETSTSLAIANVAGVVVFTGNVSGEGFVALQQGLYVYDFGGRTGKIYVR